MKLIDVFNLMAKDKIKKGTKLIIITPKGKEYEYEYAINILNGHWSFVDDYDRGITYRFDITVDTLQCEVRLVEQKEKKYLVKFNMRGLRNGRKYLNYDELGGHVNLNDNCETSSIQTRFTKKELQDIQKVREFLEDMQGKYELIEVGKKENEND